MYLLTSVARSNAMNHKLKTNGKRQLYSALCHVYLQVTPTCTKKHILKTNSSSTSEVDAYQLRP